MIRRLTCPTCDKELPVEIDGESALFPFCSDRCKLADLNRWLTGEHLIVESLNPEQLSEELLRQDDSSEEADY